MILVEMAIVAVLLLLVWRSIRTGKAPKNASWPFGTPQDGVIIYSIGLSIVILGLMVHIAHVAGCIEVDAFERAKRPRATVDQSVRPN
jgi:hypothetical protein